MGVKEKPVETGLSTVGDKTFGKSLVAAAQAKNREAVGSAVVGKVQEILVHVQKQKDYIRQSEANVALLEQQIRAIEAGAFTVSVYGVITLNDKELNAGVVRMAECSNCGHSGRRSI